MKHQGTQDDVSELESPERRATLQAILVMLSGVTITIAGCGGDDNPIAPDGSESGSVSANHNHTAVITSAQLTAASAVVLQIQGSASHPHTVDLTAGEIGQIAAGTRVVKISSTDNSQDFGSHNHTVTFN